MLIITLTFCGLQIVTTHFLISMLCCNNILNGYTYLTKILKHYDVNSKIFSNES